MQLPSGTPAPPFTVSTLDNRVITQQTFRGHVLLLDIWATWCPPCQMTTPIMERLAEKFGSKSVYVLGISVDDADTAGQVPDFVKSHHVRYTVASSPDQNKAIGRAYNVRGIPAIYLIDKHGRVRWCCTGIVDDEEQRLTAMIQQLAAEK
jgi:thiol-disulfide isomerase/thioredoxin